MSKNKDLVVADYSKYANIGLKDITNEDIRPPVAFLVQSIKDKSELVGQDGRECPDGSFFLKGVNEVFKSMTVYFVWIKKDHYQVKEDSKTDMRWDGSRMYRTIAVRADDMTPFAISFVKSSLGAVNDLLTAAKSKNLPVFLFKCELKAVLTTNKTGNDYFKAVVSVKSIESDKDICDRLFAMAQGFDIKDDVKTQEDEVIEAQPEQSAAEVAEVMDQEPEQQAPTGEKPEVEDVSDDIPF